MGSIEGADVLFTGHTHRGIVAKTNCLVFDARGSRITPREQVLVTTTSWLAYGGYAARKMLAPASNGNPPIVKLGGTHANKKLTVIW